MGDAKSNSTPRLDTGNGIAAQRASSPTAATQIDSALLAQITETVCEQIELRSERNDRRNSEAQRRPPPRVARLNRRSSDRVVGRTKRPRRRRRDSFHEDLRAEYRRSLYKSLAVTLLFNVMFNWSSVVAWWQSSFVPQLEPFVMPSYLHQFDTWSTAADAIDVIQSEINSIDRDLDSAAGDSKNVLMQRRIGLGQELTQLLSTAAFYREKLDEYAQRYGKHDLSVEVLRARAKQQAPVILD